jgi:hypothetical protein
MKPQPVQPAPPEDVQFLLSLLRISFPGEAASRESLAIQELLKASR